MNSIAGASQRALADRARAAAGKVERTKNMVLYYLLSRDLKKIEGHQFTLRAQKNSQDSVRITDEAAVPKSIAEFMRGLTELSGRQSFRFFRMNSRRPWNHPSRKSGLTQMRSKRLQCGMNMSQERKFGGIHT